MCPEKLDPANPFNQNPHPYAIKGKAEDDEASIKPSPTWQGYSAPTVKAKYSLVPPFTDPALQNDD